MSSGKVTIESEHFEPLFGNVTCGQFCIYKNNLCVRTSRNGSGEWEAFDFVLKDKIHIPHTDRVAMVNCEISYRFCILSGTER